MVGNDVVDLRDREAAPGGASRSRFDERVFAACEREGLDASPAQRWRLWAAKEAAFKACKQRDLDLVWSPRAFVATLDAAGRGVVDGPAGRVEVHVEIEQDAVHAVTVCGCEPLHALRRCPAELAPAALSAAVRALAREQLAVALDLSPDEIAFDRNGRIPELQIEGARVPGALSFSHHGAVVGFAWRPDARRPGAELPEKTTA